MKTVRNKEKKMKLSTSIKNSKFARICGKIFSHIQKADRFLLKYKVYQWICIVLFSVMTVLLITSYNITETHSNYQGQTDSVFRFYENAPISFSFQADESRLTSIRLYTNRSQTHLSSSDKAEVTVADENGKEVLSTDVYLYHTSRTYITVDCQDVALEKGSKYTVSIKITELAGDSVLYLMAHETNNFDAVTDATVTADLPVGLSLAPNVTFSYSVLSISHMIPNQLFFLIFLIGLFIPSLMKKRWVCEVYRPVFLCSLVYMTEEILNTAKPDPMQILFPLTLHHYFILAAGILILILFYYWFYALTGSGTVAIIVSGTFGIILGFVNHFKIVMRGDPAMPWDLFSAGIAAKISTKYKFQITPRFIAAILICAMLLLLVRLTHTRYVHGLKKRLIAVGVSTALLAALIFGVLLNQPLLKKMDVSYALFPPLQSFNENGTLLALALHLNNVSIRGQENNSPEATDDIIAQYTEEADSLGLNSSAVTAVKPNVICIMSESYSDFREIRDIETTEPIMPFFDSLKQESIYGDLAVSVFGGGTCNTEFEFLTGYSVKGLLAGSSVYSLYVNHPLNALPQIFKDNGYKSIAIHPFDSAWWERQTAYPLLGFDEFISDDDFVDPQYVRGYISDKSAFERVITEYEQKDEGTPLFTFLVTMQNHADYTEYWDNQAYDIKITNFPDNDFPCTEHYLSLLRESDDALKELVTYFENADEPTIIVFFGDHKPFVDTDFYSTLLGVDLSKISASESLPIYETPYLIWANYDIGTGDKGITSPNFLGQTVLDLSGVPSPKDRDCLKVLQTKIAAISALAVFGKDQTAATDDSLLSEEIRKNIEDYEFIQYGMLFLNGKTEESSSG